MLGEDVEDQLRAVHHPELQLGLQIALLPGAQVLVADEQVAAPGRELVSEFCHLALAHVEGGLDLLSALDLLPHHLRAGGAGQLFELGHL